MSRRAFGYKLRMSRLSNLFERLTSHPVFLGAVLVFSLAMTPLSLGVFGGKPNPFRALVLVVVAVYSGVEIVRQLRARKPSP